MSAERKAPPVSPSGASPTVAELALRDREIWKLSASGYTRVEISEKLSVTYASVAGSLEREKRRALVRDTLDRGIIRAESRSRWQMAAREALDEWRAQPTGKRSAAVLMAAMEAFKRLDIIDRVDSAPPQAPSIGVAMMGAGSTLSIAAPQDDFWKQVLTMSVDEKEALVRQLYPKETIEATVLTDGGRIPATSNDEGRVTMTASEIVTKLRADNDQSGVGPRQVQELLDAGVSEADILAEYGAFSGASGLTPELAGPKAETERLKLLRNARAARGATSNVNVIALANDVAALKLNLAAAHDEIDALKAQIAGKPAAEPGA